jgi:peptidoglycan/LPS O-acetylase OafA/YrhL
MKNASTALLVPYGLAPIVSRVFHGLGVVWTALRCRRELITPGAHSVPELDGIRGIACILIVLLHCLIGISDFAQGSLLQEVKSETNVFLIGGVDLFFVLSGFLIGGILMDNRQSENFFRAFWTRRIARIFPVNYVLLASFVVVLAVRKNFDLPWLDIWLLKGPTPPLWTYATFTQSIPMAVAGEAGPRWLGITWSLAIEEQFYLIFPVLIFFLSRRAIWLVAVAGILIAPVLWAIIEWKTGQPYTGYVLLPCRVSALLLGVLVACVIRNPKTLSICRRYRVLIDCVTLFIFYSIIARWLHVYAFNLKEQNPFLAILLAAPMQYLILATMFALLMLRIYLYEGGLFRRLLRMRILIGAGLISYALYMYHQAVNGLLHGFLLNQVPRVASGREIVVAIAVIAIAVGLATLSYFFLERPIRRLGQRVKFVPKGDLNQPLAPELVRAH